MLASEGERTTNTRDDEREDNRVGRASGPRACHDEGDRENCESIARASDGIGPERSRDDGSTLFVPGSEWLLCRLYGGWRGLERSIERIESRCEDLRSRGLIDVWTFLRLAEPDRHLALRVHMRRPKEQFPEVALQMAALCEEGYRTGILWMVEWAAFRPEYGRFGGERLWNLAQTIGHSDARLAAAMSRQATIGSDERIVCAVVAAEQLLHCFGIAIRERANLVGAYRSRVEALVTPCRRDHANWFRSRRREIGEQVRAGMSGSVGQALQDRLRVLEAAAATVRQEWVPSIRGEFAVRCIHMTANRIVPVWHHQTEYAIADVFCLYYRSLRTKERRSESDVV